MLLSTSTFLSVSEKVADQLLPWLMHTSGSLTKKLKEQTGDAQLQLLQQSWSRAAYWDKQVLGLDNSQLFKREVIMYSNHRPCWYAKTIIPENCYFADEAFFNQLQQGKLTTLVFDEPRVKRKKLFHYAITSQCLEYFWVDAFNPSKESPLWLRFSIFEFLESQEFYLIEIFLANFFEVIA